MKRPYSIFHTREDVYSGRSLFANRQAPDKNNHGEAATKKFTDESKSNGATQQV